METPTKFNSLIQLLNYFPDDNSCRHYLEQKRSKGKPKCSHCGHNEKVYKLKDGKTYKCSKCKRRFNVLIGTIFENTKISLKKWFIAIYIATSHKKGISSIQLAKDLGITQKSAWHMLHRIREMLREKAPHMLDGEVEVDESYFGGKEKNKHKSKRTEGTQGRSTKTKTPLVGMAERGGIVRIEKVDGVSAGVIHPIVLENIQPGSSVMTDEWAAYKGLEAHYAHSVVNHGEGQYVSGSTHTNTIEGVWSQLKRGIYGIYHHVSDKHLQRYANAYAFRYNTRKMDEGSRFDQSLTQCQGRLSYHQLTKG